MLLQAALLSQEVVSFSRWALIAVKNWENECCSVVASSVKRHKVALDTYILCPVLSAVQFHLIVNKIMLFVICFVQGLY